MSHRLSPTRLLLTALLTAFVALALGAPSALAVVTITPSPASPTSSDPVTFTANSDQPLVTPTYEWTVDGIVLNATGDSITRTLSRGAHNLSVTATGLGGGTDAGSLGNFGVSNSPPDPPTLSGPASAVVGQPVTFTANGTDPDGDGLQFFWGMPAGCAASGPGAPNQGATMTCTFAAPGQATMSVGSNDGTSASTGSGTKVVQVVAANQLPVASFTFSPAAPRVGEPINLRSTSTDPDGSIASYAWDYDNNGTIDSNAANPTARFDNPGQHAVKLTVTDTSGTPDEIVQTIPVGQPPTASFTFSPAAPGAGTAVTFTATSSDANGFVTANNWDLDGNGTFDAQGTSVQHVFPLPGFYTVTLQAKDNEQITAVASQTIVVGPAPTTPGPNIQKVPTSKPTPVVTRISATVAFAGKKLRQGVWLSNMTVSGPRNAKVSATCHGKGCPRRVKSFLVGKRGKARVKALERRTLRFGVRIVIRVTRKGAYGKYTRVSVIKKRGFGDVQRKDSCVFGSRIKRCPATTT